MADPMTHYKRYESEYRKISDSLSSVRRIFCNADRYTQKSMLLDSSVFAVVSVQNSISILRKVFRGYCNADSWLDVRDSFKSANYGNNKLAYVKHNVDVIFGQVGDKIIDYFEAGDVWGATRIMVENIKGVSWIKAPFIGAMLGFKELLCIDTNVAQMVPGTKASGYNSMGEYKEAIELVKEEFPELANELSTFMLQWVVFDCNRGTGVAHHEEWFEQMLPGSSFGRQTGLDSF